MTARNHGALTALTIAATLCAHSCSDSGLETQYFALDRDFRDFRSWPRIAVGAAALEGHPAGERFVYRRPLTAEMQMADAGIGVDGGPAFQQGTILVKTVETGTPDTWEIFAMVKRGGAYNFVGARGWEFLKLKITPEGIPFVVARGVNPGDGMNYRPVGSTVALTCNQCHATPAAIQRDAVLSDAIMP